MEKQVFFAFSLIEEGTTEKELHFMQHKSIYSKTLCFIEQKMYFWTQQRFKQEKNLLYYIIYLIKKTLVTFSELPPVG